MTGTAPEKQGLSSDHQESSAATTTLDNASSLLPQQFTQAFTPGNVLLVSSFPFCYRAYRDYHKYSEMIVQRRVPSSTTTDNKLGMMVASRALGIATRGSVGLFALTGSLIFFWNGWSSLSDAVHSTQAWAQSRRQRLLTLFGMKDHNNIQDHPDFVETKHMTDEQTLDYLAKKYFVSQEEDTTTESHKDQ